MEFNTIISLLGMLMLGGSFGLVLVYIAGKFKVEGNPVVDEINNILPQTQCGQCTFPGCRPYAQAIADGDAPINQCPPGGQETIKQLAELLDVEALELNPENGMATEDTVVEIVEEDCIGCTKCIQVCPVDAIIGTAKKMHTVIADECTGCDLCIPACPVDCIVVVKATMPAYIHRQLQPDLLHSIEQAQQW